MDVFHNEKCEKEKKMKKCIIVGAGNIEIERLNKEKDDLLIAADGGYRALADRGIIPDYLIGDMDSLADEGLLRKAREMQIEISQLPTQKDDTDMLAAIREGLQRGYQCFELFGALGGRLDHTFANLQCLKYIQEQGAEGVILENHTQTFLLKNGKIEFPASMRGTISVFSFEDCASGVTEIGLKYEVNNAELTNAFPIGISNEFAGKDSSIEVKNGVLLIHMITQ